MSLANEVGPGLDGLGQMRALLASGRKPGIAESLDFDLLEVDDGRAVFTGQPGSHAYNPIGTVHGGYAATLLDSCCGCAAHTKLTATQVYTTVEIKVSYLRPITRDTGRLRAEGTVISSGRKVAFTEGKLVDEAGKVYATATSTLLIFDR